MRTLHLLLFCPFSLEGVKECGGGFNARDSGAPHFSPCSHVVTEIIAYKSQVNIRLSFPRIQLDRFLKFPDSGLKVSELGFCDGQIVMGAGVVGCLSNPCAPNDNLNFGLLLELLDSCYTVARRRQGRINIESLSEGSEGSVQASRFGRQHRAQFCIQRGVTGTE